MPILDQEPDLFPENLFEEPPGEDRKWWVVHTLPKQEKALARELYRCKVSYYLPTEQHRVKIRSKFKIITKPMFNGYVFIWVHRDERSRAFATNRVAKMLDVVDQERFWSDISRVRRVLDLGVPVTPEKKIEAGTIVTLRDGPLTGMTGTVIKAAGGFKFVVMVNFIQQGMSITVDGAMLGLND